MKCFDSHSAAADACCPHSTNRPDITLIAPEGRTCPKADSTWNGVAPWYLVANSKSVLSGSPWSKCYGITAINGQGGPVATVLIQAAQIITRYKQNSLHSNNRASMVGPGRTPNIVKGHNILCVRQGGTYASSDRSRRRRNRRRHGHGDPQ
jgi:hypothetical protein